MLVETVIVLQVFIIKIIFMPKRQWLSSRIEYHGWDVGGGSLGFVPAIGDTEEEHPLRC